MRPLHPLIVLGLGAWLSACSSVPVLAQLSGTMPSVSVRIEVVDEQGQPVPYATTWQVVATCKNPYSSRKGAPCLTPAELMLISTRVRETFEYAASYSAPRPYATMRLPVAANAKGLYDDHTPPDELLSTYNLTNHSKTTRVGLAFLKQGYLPAVADFELTTGKPSYRGRVVLRKDPEYPRQDSANRREYERIRYELSDGRKNDEMSAANARRLTTLRADLERVARDAEQAGDGPLAARAYYRLAYMPSVGLGQTSADGKTVFSGYSAGGVGPQSDALRQKARELDPDSPFFFELKSRKMLPKGIFEQKEFSEGDKAIIMQFAQSAAAEFEPMFDRLWPKSSIYFVGVFDAINRFDKVYEWLDQFRQRDPKYEALEDFFEFLRRDMKKAKVPIPSDWNMDPYPPELMQ